ncbi:hypothetical protein BDZ97DRAFT_2063672 [Flammula alnicola]|nr:hypothetical protein BDZ97DRAFT_2063672 [Flammula alnicola]
MHRKRIDRYRREVSQEDKDKIKKEGPANRVEPALGRGMLSVNDSDFTISETRADTLRKDDFDKFSTGMIVSSSSTAASSTTTTSDYTSAWKHAGYTKVPLVFLRIQIHLGDKGEAGGTDSSHNCASTSLQTTPPELAALSTPKPRAVHTLLNLGIHSIKHAEMYDTPSGDHVLPRQGQMEG